MTKYPLLLAVSISVFAHMAAFAAIAMYEPTHRSFSEAVVAVHLVAVAASAGESVPQTAEDATPPSPPIREEPAKQVAEITELTLMPIAEPMPTESSEAEAIPAAVVVENIAPDISPELVLLYEANTYSNEHMDASSYPATEIELPRELSFPEPHYPPIAKRRKQEGSVVVEIFIDKNGRVTDMRLVSSSGHKALDNAALSIKDRLRYSPASEGGEPMAFTLTKTITFRLENK